MSGQPPRYRRLDPKGAAADLESGVLAQWREEDLFRRTLDARAGAPPFVFFEGPPTANGRPGIHHVFARTLKDLFCRHRAMAGYDVARKAGWDTHGLPVEIEVEKQLGLSGKPDIETLGVERFNALCRESVFQYRGDWERLSERIGYWLDYEHPYVTYSNDYVESVWWALKTMYDRQLLYRGHKILPYCARCGTALSSHEVAQGYEEVDDPSVFVALRLRTADGEREPDGGARLLIWTTTPWTLVSNVAIAVHPDLEYVELRRRGGDAARIILADARTTAVLGDAYDARWEVVRRWRGSDLAGRRYERPLDWVGILDGASEIIIAESFVSADDGTGIVHLAPAFGADDFAAGQRHGLAFLQPVDARGEFLASVPVVAGLFVKKADPLIIDELRTRQVLWKTATITHSYPHCWRCGTPLLYYARTSWFVRTTAFRDQMLARNARVDWHPADMGEGRFGEWLTNNIDWAISRDRYWGTPLPVWVCDTDSVHTEAIGSYAELASTSGAPLPNGFDPHKPYIDRYTWPCARCAKDSAPGTMRRTPEVIDAWFDSGSMPFAQWHFPFENRDLLERSYPADFIAEGVDQTRGWFYSLLAIATALGPALPNNGVDASAPDTSVGAAPYRSVLVNDLVLDADGVKMSKSRGNVVDPWDVIGRHGSDAVRLFLVSSSQVWLPRRFDESVIRETAGRFLLTLKHIYSGIFAEYANFGWRPSANDPPPAARPLLDRWILSRLSTVERETERLLREYDATAAARGIIGFVDDDLSNWYVRLSRHRFYEIDGDDHRAAFATLHEVLTVCCRLLAPFTPFLTDWMHRELVGTSVHLAPFTRDHGDALVDIGLERAMAQVRVLSRLGRAAREEAGVKVRQPLSRMVCVLPGRTEGDVMPLATVLAAELNVKRVEFASSADSLVTLSAKPAFRHLGKKFGKDTPLAAAAIAALSSDVLRGFERGTPVSIVVGDVDRALDADDVAIVRRASGDLVVSEDGGYFVGIDPAISGALREEGIARELVSWIQRTRREMGLAVSDRVRVVLEGDGEVEHAARTHREWVASEVLARSVIIGRAEINDEQTMPAVELDGFALRIAITKEG